MNSSNFWQQIDLAKMDAEQWESLCDDCGKYCLQNIIDWVNR